MTMPTIPKTPEELRALEDDDLQAIREALDDQAEKLRLLRMAIARECERRVNKD